MVDAVRDTEGIDDSVTVRAADADAVQVAVVEALPEVDRVLVPLTETLRDTEDEPDAVVDAVSVDVVETDGVVVCERLTLNV